MIEYSSLEKAPATLREVSSAFLAAGSRPFEELERRQAGAP